MVSGLRAAARLPVVVLLGEEIQPPLAEAIEPRYRLLAADPVEHRVAEDVGHRDGCPVGQHHDAEPAVRNHVHTRAPTDPATIMCHRALAAVGVASQAKTVMLLTDLVELRARYMHKRRLHQPEAFCRKQADTTE